MHWRHLETGGRTPQTHRRGIARQNGVVNPRQSPEMLKCETPLTHRDRATLQAEARVRVEEIEELMGASPF